MNNFDILIIGVTILIGLIVIYFSISTIIETRKLAIDQYEENSKIRKRKFDEKH